MRHTLVRFMGWIGLVALVGCAGSGEVIPLQLHPVPADAGKMAKPVASIRVTLADFEDGRTYRTGIGVRTHLGGGVSYFDVAGGNPADAVAQALAEYLTAKGWHVVQQGVRDGAEVVFTGKIQEFVVHARSQVGLTEMTTKTTLTLRATNRADGSVIRMTLNGAGSDDVFWFDPEDMQDLVNEVLTDSFGKLTQDTMVENGMLRLKSP